MEHARVDSARAAPALRPHAVYGALAANALIAAAKFAAAFATGSAALLAESIHSVADTMNEVLLLVGVSRARRPPDAAHPYGHGKELYFWGLIVAILLFFVGGIFSIYAGIRKLSTREELRSGVWGYAVLGVALVFESTSLYIAVRELRKETPSGTLLGAVKRSKDPSVFTVVAEDTTAIAGVGVALAGVLVTDLFHEPRADAIASILIGVLLAGVAVFLASETRNLLVGESGDPRLVSDLRRLIESDADVVSIRSLLTMQLGSRQVLLNAALEFSGGLSSGDVARAVERLETKIERAHPRVTRIFLEAALPDSSAPASPSPVHPGL